SPWCSQTAAVTRSCQSAPRCPVPISPPPTSPFRSPSATTSCRSRPWSNSWRTLSTSHSFYRHMRFTEPSTDRPRRLQSGQAIVLIALMMIVLIGMLGLAIDGGRAYIDRRELQDAVDAAVLAAGDNFELQGDTNQAAAQAAKLFALNEHIANYGAYSSGGTACPATFPAGSTCTLYTWGGYPGTFTFGY